MSSFKEKVDISEKILALSEEERVAYAKYIAFVKEIPRECGDCVEEIAPLWLSALYRHGFLNRISLDGTEFGGCALSHGPICHQVWEVLGLPEGRWL